MRDPIILLVHLIATLARLMGPGPVTGSRASDPDPEVPAKVERRRFPPPRIGSASSRKSTRASGPARWAPCCVARGCTRRS